LSSPAFTAHSTNLVDLASSCFAGDVDRAVDEILNFAADGRGGYVCLCNVHVLTAALHDPALQRALEGAELRFPDGAPVAWLLRGNGRPHARRVGGPDLFERVIDRGRRVGLRHFLIGSTEPDLARLESTLVTRFPGVRIVGRHAPPYAEKPEVDGAALATARAGGAQVAWVALGAPKQELWMAEAAPALPDTMLIGVGAAFDFLAGKKRRAPAWMQRAGLEWLFRMVSEPRRLTWRYVRANLEFIARIGFELPRRLRAG
jgi:N-acetylglucosaminyldiphosphoundecaprenol N-acetyl-beta-D-mannosaminyltransferase